MPAKNFRLLNRQLIAKKRNGKECEVITLLFRNTLELCGTWRKGN
jgi:hypothetical protein